jgi:hypothetical protein
MHDGTAKHTPPDALAENGTEAYGWRMVDGAPRLVVVRIGFTLRGQEHEEFRAFKARMLRFATQLTEECGYAVASLQLHQRAAQHKTPWAEFDCLTPEFHLPVKDT